VITPSAYKDSYKGAKGLGSILTLPNFLSCSVLRAVASAMKVAVVLVGREMTVAHLPSASFLATFLGSTTFNIQNYSAHS